jgi:hypothetical protein
MISSGAGKNKIDDGVGARLLKGQRRSAQGSTGGHDIVDERNAGRRCRPALKGSGDIFLSLA